MYVSPSPFLLPPPPPAPPPPFPAALRGISNFARSHCAIWGFSHCSPTLLCRAVLPARPVCSCILTHDSSAKQSALPTDGHHRTHETRQRVKQRQRHSQPGAGCCGGRRRISGASVDGALLRQVHVDRSDTHIISAIINVAQDLEEPWPLEIVGHSMQRSLVPPAAAAAPPCVAALHPTPTLTPTPTPTPIPIITLTPTLTPTPTPLVGPLLVQAVVSMCASEPGRRLALRSGSWRAGECGA